MTSVADLVQMLKAGELSKSAFMQKISSPSAVLGDYNRHTDPAVPLKLDLSAIKSALPCDSFATSNQTNSSRPSSSFSIRQDQWLSRRSMSNAKLKEAKVDEEVKDCTFQPKITSLATTKEGSFQRLTDSRSRQSLERLRSELKQKENFDQLKECTFQPAINPKSRTVSTRPSTITSPRNSQDIERYTFTPSILGVKRTMSRATEYVQSPAFERLTAPKPEDLPLPTVEFEVLKPIPYESEFVSQPFFERQAAYEVKKLERHAGRIKQLPPKPKINELSKKLITTDFATRNKAFIEKQNKPRAAYDPECSFHPSITKLPYEVKQPPKHRTCHNTPPQPKSPPKPTSTSSGYSYVKSRLQLQEDPDTYIARVTLQQRERQNFADNIKALKAEQELAECTHRPAITEAPSYIRQIATAYADQKPK